MNSKAFTLIELLVEVAIIGILAAVGVTTFNGFQEKAKVSTVKANHAALRIYIIGELQKCNLGNTKTMSDQLTCQGNTSAKTVTAAVAALSDFKNPYSTSSNAVGSSTKYVLGATNLSASGVQVNIKTCFEGDCTKGEMKTMTQVVIE